MYLYKTMVKSLHKYAKASLAKVTKSDLNNI